jgi:hypothetical protein
MMLIICKQNEHTIHTKKQCISLVNDRLTMYALRLFITAIIEIEELLKTNVMANNQVK